MLSHGGVKIVRDCVLLAMMTFLGVLATNGYANWWLCIAMMSVIGAWLYLSRRKEIEENKAMLWFKSTWLGKIVLSPYVIGLTLILADGYTIQSATGVNVRPLTLIGCAVFVAYRSYKSISAQTYKDSVAEFKELTKDLPVSTKGTAASAVILAMISSVDFSICDKQIVISDDKTALHGFLDDTPALEPVMALARTVSLYYEHGVSQEQIDRVADVTTKILKSASFSWLLVRVPPYGMSTFARRLSMKILDDVNRVSQMVKPGKPLSASAIGVKRESIGKSKAV